MMKSSNAVACRQRCQLTSELLLPNSIFPFCTKGLKAAVFARNCRIYSQPCLGIVLKQMNHNGLEGSSGEGSILQVCIVPC